MSRIHELERMVERLTVQLATARADALRLAAELARHAGSEAHAERTAREADGDPVKAARATAATIALAIEAMATRTANGA